MQLNAVEDGVVSAKTADDVAGFTAPDEHAAVVGTGIKYNDV